MTQTRVVFRWSSVVLQCSEVLNSWSHVRYMLGLKSRHGRVLETAPETIHPKTSSDWHSEKNPSGRLPSYWRWMIEFALLEAEDA